MDQLYAFFVCDDGSFNGQPVLAKVIILALVIT